jgi:hypothetical protein
LLDADFFDDFAIAEMDNANISDFIDLQTLVRGHKKLLPMP